MTFEVSFDSNGKDRSTFRMSEKGGRWNVSLDGVKWHEVTSRATDLDGFQIRIIEEQEFHPDAGAGIDSTQKRPLAEVALISAPELVVMDLENREISRHLLPLTETTEVLIGRSARKCDISIPDPKVSRIHLVITRRAGQYYVSDHESSHGTFVNGNAIDANRPLGHDDLIELGNSRLRFIDLVGLIRSRTGDDANSVIIPADTEPAERPELISPTPSLPEGSFIEPSSNVTAGRLGRPKRDPILEPWMIMALAASLTILALIGLIAVVRRWIQ